MQKIKLMADAACDISDKFLEQYNIEMVSIPITIDGESYFERESFSMDEFYDILAASKEIPKTSRVMEHVYVEAYEDALEKGYTDIFNITINAGGSGTNVSAHQAAKTFYEKHPYALKSIAIHIIDSKTYSMAYGHPIVLAAQMIEQGTTVEELEAFFLDWFNCVDIYLGCYTLEYAKKSGRINAAAAFVGELLGMRPIIRMVEGKTTVTSKIRGDKNIIPKVFDEYIKARPSKDTEIMVLHGRNKAQGKELQKMVEKELGRKIPIYQIGASIAINAGPDIVAIVLRGKKRK